MLPFTREQFFQVFSNYNDAIWPAQIAFYLLAAATIWLVLKPRPLSGRLVTGILALMWAWTGVGYHLIFFSAVNKAAYAFAAMFVLQAIWLGSIAVGRAPLRFSSARSPKRWLGLGLIVYATIIYPLIGLASGHSFAELPMFGVTPCPVTIFTFGVLLLADTVPSRGLLVVPFVWSMIGGSASVLLGVPQDWALLAAGLAVVPMLLRVRAPSGPGVEPNAMNTRA